MKKLPIFLFLFVLLSCNDEYDLRIVKEIQVIQNPSGQAPLTAQLLIETKRAVSVKMRVIGKNGSASDVIQEFPEVGESLNLMVLGLYPNYENQVELTFYNTKGKEIGQELVQIQTDPLSTDFPDITIDVPATGDVMTGMNLVNYFGFDTEQRPNRPFIFDNFGDIRWYLDLTEHEVLYSSFLDNGLNVLKNGNFVFGDKLTDALYEVDRYGEILNTWELEGYGFHHHIIEKPNGNFIVTVDDFSKNTVEDVILELDRTTGDIVNTWDLNISLDNTRDAWDTDLTNIAEDWFHGNGLEYDESDNTIIVSGRTQGVVKLNESNEVVWIMAPHKGWSTAGNGTDLTQYLLQPLDAQNQPITNQQVLDGETNHADFEWNWYQHSPVLMPNGNIVLFDNGDNRNYSDVEKYSRAVEFKIDETNKTIQQVWDYGKTRGAACYSRIVSKVWYFENEDNVLFTPGAVQYNGDDYGKIIEVDRSTNEVQFEATIRPPNVLFIITFHNAARVDLYPN